jgi:hypothetical protein
MKRLVGLIVIVLLGMNVTYAQTATTKKVTKTVKKVEVKAKSSPVVIKKEVEKVKVAGPTKKDGTADMRYKANKQAKAAGPTKKDGTADMRYKANKAAKKN